jgi:hypothetical protein
VSGEFKKVAGFWWTPAEMTKKKTLPAYEYDDGIEEMLDECLRLCPNDPLLRSFAGYFAEYDRLTERQYANLKRFYDSWGGNVLP